MRQRSLVSVIINNYNYEKFLDRSIESVLAQTYQNIELIVVDDGSTDNSRDLVLQYRNKLKYVFKDNEDHASTFNAGFSVSKGDIICFLDADDIFLPEKVEKVVEVFESKEEIGWCFHPLTLVSTETEQVLGRTRAFPDNSSDLSMHIDFRANMRNGRIPFYAPSTSGLCFSRILLNQLLPMPISLKQAADRYLTSLAIYKSQGYFLNSELTIQGIHGKNDGTLQESNHSKLKKSRNQIAMAYHLKQKYPELYKYCNRSFSRGMSFISKSRKHLADSNDLVNKYMENTSFKEKIVIYLTAIYQARPWKRSNLYASSHQESS